ncbi:MAG: hypothetical protein PHQ59_02565 [Candidatus Daviesbacteria bacterium]|nr:hypothetical protein [Candidatus Daviesbacteria bacterium]
MFKKLVFCLIVAIFFFNTPNIFAAENSYVTVVNPIRGSDFWDQKGQEVETAVLGQIKILDEFKIPATFLIRFDAFSSNQLIDSLKNITHEKGLFLEVTPSWATAAGVKYRQSPVWHNAESVFLTGYDIEERKRFIDKAFEEFKKAFGSYPKSVGAWWIDSYSLEYMQNKYNIDAVLIVADQYSTDNYQIWGQYFGTPYYPAKKNALAPAQNTKNKIPVVVMQWATRDPINGYGEGVMETTYSLQANDYIDYHQLGSNYFTKLIDLFTTQPYNQVNHVVVGLENSYNWKTYQSEYRKQIELLKNRAVQRQLSLVTMEEFAKWYKLKFPDVSPAQIIIANDPLGTSKKVVWFMNQYYRAGWFYNRDGSVFRDIRQYVEGQVEPCYEVACKQINFATFSTRVLDDVTYKEKLILDKGKIADFIVKEDKEFVINYTNEAGRRRQISFLPRDISIDGKVSSIDSLILQAKESIRDDKKIQVEFSPDTTKNFQEPLSVLAFNIIKFLIFIIMVLFIPGFSVVRSLKQESLILNIFLSICIGFVGLVLVSFVAGYLKLPWLVFVYIGSVLITFFFKKRYLGLSLKQVSFSKNNILILIVLILGTIFQSLIMVRSGWVYDFGVGFWGPTGHDMVWHQALVNQLVKAVPPESPILAGETLNGYHYFFDLLVAESYKLTNISILDLLYRFFPVLFSLLLGIGTIGLLNKLTTNKIISLTSLYFVYFAGSFGWIVTYLRDKSISGESVFWVNQPVSMNINPPFAISLLLVITIVLLINIHRLNKSTYSYFLLVILIGVLVEFKVYAGVVAMGGLLIMALLEVITKRSFTYLKIFLPAAIFSAVLFIPQNKNAASLLVFSPLWFIDSMMDFADRVGWSKLSAARLAYFARGEWLKYISIEALSLFIFIAGNLGIRILLLFKMQSLFKRNWWHISEYTFMFFMGLVSLTIPLFFIQKGNPWNTIQFIYYLVYFAAIGASFGLFVIYKSLPKVLGVILLAMVMVIAPVNAWVSFSDNLGQIPPAALSQNEFEALQFLSKLPDGVVLTYPYNKNLSRNFTEPIPLFAYQTTGYVSAFSGKQSFVEDIMQNEILQTDYHPRLVASEDFFISGVIPPILEGKIKYIYLPKFFDVTVDTSKQWKKVFENNEVLIYEING